jgi:hypothetical protein
MMMCTILFMWFFVEIIDNKKLDESDKADDDVYNLYVMRYAIRTFSMLGRWCGTWSL